MWDITKDYIIWVLGILIATWQLVEEIKNRKSKIRIFFLSVGIIVLGWLGIDQINRTNNEKKNINDRFNLMTHQFESLQQAKSADSLKNDQFQKRLFLEFKITRDSITNRPTQIISNTNIKNAETVIIP